MRKISFLNGGFCPETLFSILPESHLYKQFELYRNRVKYQNSNIDFLMWAESLLDEISMRKLSRKFETLYTERIIH